MERRRSEFAVGGRYLWGKEGKGVSCGRGRSLWRGGEASLLWEEDLYGVRRGRKFAAGGKKYIDLCCVMSFIFLSKHMCSAQSHI